MFSPPVAQGSGDNCLPPPEAQGSGVEDPDFELTPLSMITTAPPVASATGGETPMSDLVSRTKICRVVSRSSGWLGCSLVNYCYKNNLSGTLVQASFVVADARGGNGGSLIVLGGIL